MSDKKITISWENEGKNKDIDKIVKKLIDIMIKSKIRSIDFEYENFKFMISRIMKATVYTSNHRDFKVFIF